MTTITNYVTYHLHTENSLLDSTTNYKDYIHRAKELGQKAICFTEHGNILNWIEKKMYCEATQYKAESKELDSPLYVSEKKLSELQNTYKDITVTELKPIKYIHGVEMYLTETLDNKVRDNYHTILIAKNYEGFKELNMLIDLSTQDDHFYYNPRISFDEFLNISDNIIKISACLKSPLNHWRKQSQPYSEEMVDGVRAGIYERLMFAYDFYEIQPHANSIEQAEYNRYLADLSASTGVPFIAATDTHSLNKYKAECRQMLQWAKNKFYDNEEEFDLTYRTYDELVHEFKLQNALSKEVYMQAIENTNVMADMVDEFTLDKSFKYPVLYPNEEEVLLNRIQNMKQDKIDRGEIEGIPQYQTNIDEEISVFREIGMIGFMLFMSELCCWCHDNDIPIGPGRGSVSGSTVAYITDITDIDPVKHKTVFSRFANKDRKELGDIDLDFAPNDREKVYKHIIESFSEDYTAYILTTGTIADKGTIDEIVRGFHNKWCRDRGINPKNKNTGSPYSLDFAKIIKDSFEVDEQMTRAKYKDIFYYFDGLNGVVISKGIHPAGIVVSPVTLPDNYGTYWSDGKRVLSINMEEIHEVSLLKYDILGLKNVGIISDVYKMLGKQYPKAYQIDWDNDEVWKDMLSSSIGIFQFENDYAFNLLKQFKPTILPHLSVLNAALRPSGASYRDRLISGEKNINPSPLIDELLADNNGYLIFQEDTIKFLTEICGLSGGDADNIRRAIGRKQKDRLMEAIPDILEGYCSKSDKPREIAEQEAKAFLQIIEDSSDYQFGYNHSMGYSMIGYLCAYLRYFYPKEFIASYINNASNPKDVTDGVALAQLKGIAIQPVKFRHSRADYFVSDGKVYKGIGTIPYMNKKIAEEMYSLRNVHYEDFIDLLYDIKSKTSVDSRQLEILISIDFFSEFGDINKLLSDYSYFKKLYGKCSIRKDSLEALSLSEETVRAFSGKETDTRVESIDCVVYLKSLDLSESVITHILESVKLKNGYSSKKIYKLFNTSDADKRRFADKIVQGAFSDIDIKGLLKYIHANKDIEKCSLKSRIKYQTDYLGYIDYIDPSLDWRYIVITDLDTKHSPKFNAYSIGKGKATQMKVYKNSFTGYGRTVRGFSSDPFKVGDVLYIKSFCKKPKTKKVDGSFVTIPDSFDWWITDYIKVE